MTSRKMDEEFIKNHFKEEGKKVISIRQLPCSKSRAVGYLGGFMEYRVRYEDNEK